jgi:hypothetical protein
VYQCFTNVEGIELRELRAFLVLAEELHFGRTAERLRLTPSRVEVSRALYGDAFQCLRRAEIDLLVSWLPHGQPDLAQLVHRAYAHVLDLTLVVAAGFALAAGIAVLVVVRPHPTTPSTPAAAAAAAGRRPSDLVRQAGRGKQTDHDHRERPAAPAARGTSPFDQRSGPSRSAPARDHARRTLWSAH